MATCASCNQIYFKTVACTSREGYPHHLSKPPLKLALLLPMPPYPASARARAALPRSTTMHSASVAAAWVGATPPKCCGRLSSSSVMDSMANRCCCTGGGWCGSGVSRSRQTRRRHNRRERRKGGGGGGWAAAPAGSFLRAAGAITSFVCVPQENLELLTARKQAVGRLLAGVERAWCPADFCRCL